MTDQRGPDEQVLYAAVVARRAPFDNLLWQVPVLSLTAQAFLFALALGGDTSRLARTIAAALSLVVTFLSTTLMARHRQAELADAHWLADFEEEHNVPDRHRAHGAPWAQRRDAVDVEVGIWNHLVFPLKGYRTWICGLYVFGVAAVVVLVLAMFAPTTLT